MDEGRFGKPLRSRTVHYIARSNGGRGRYSHGSDEVGARLQYNVECLHSASLNGPQLGGLGWCHLVAMVAKYRLPEASSHLGPWEDK